MYIKLEGFFFLLFTLINNFDKFIALMSFFKFILCAMEKQQSCMLSVNKTCLFAQRFFKVSNFSCKSVASQLVDNFYLRTVSVCQEWVFGFGSERSITKRKKLSRLSPQTN